MSQSKIGEGEGERAPKGERKLKHREFSQVQHRMHFKKKQSKAKQTTPDQPQQHQHFRFPVKHWGHTLFCSVQLCLWVATIAAAESNYQQCIHFQWYCLSAPLLLNTLISSITLL